MVHFLHSLHLNKYAQAGYRLLQVPIFAQQEALYKIRSLSLKNKSLLLLKDSLLFPKDSLLLSEAYRFPV